MNAHTYINISSSPLWPRSAAAVAAYLITQGMTKQMALKSVKDGNSLALVDSKFDAQLETLEASMLRKPGGSSSQ